MLTPKCTHPEGWMGSSSCLEHGDDLDNVVAGSSLSSGHSIKKSSSGRAGTRIIKQKRAT